MDLKDRYWKVDDFIEILDLIRKKPPRYTSDRCALHFIERWKKLRVGIFSTIDCRKRVQYCVFVCVGWLVIDSLVDVVKYEKRWWLTCSACVLAGWVALLSRDITGVSDFTGHLIGVITLFKTIVGAHLVRVEFSQSTTSRLKQPPGLWVWSWKHQKIKSWILFQEMPHSKMGFTWLWKCHHLQICCVPLFFLNSLPLPIVSCGAAVSFHQEGKLARFTEWNPRRGQTFFIVFSCHQGLCAGCHENDVFVEGSNWELYKNSFQGSHYSPTKKFVRFDEGTMSWDFSGFCMFFFERGFYTFLIRWHRCTKLGTPWKVIIDLEILPFQKQSSLPTISDSLDILSLH